ncbi:hypothetical protein GF322_02825 [Candidatus Dependentiae bacterium]|nr:hypothetical protein [Candidatus Dependentiae bacterium]
MAVNAENLSITLKGFSELAEIFNQNGHSQEASFLICIAKGILGGGELFYNELKENPGEFSKDLVLCGGLNLAVNFCSPVGALVFASNIASVFTAGSEVYKHISSLSKGKRLEETVKIIVYSSIKGLCIKKGLQVSSSVVTANFQIVKGILKNALIAEKFVDGLKVYTQLAKKFGPKISQKAIKILRVNPSLVEQEKDLASAANKVTKIEKKIEKSGILQKLLREAKFVQRHDHQWETVLSDGNKLILRRDIGKYAHRIGRKYRQPTNHWNIEVHIFDNTSSLDKPKFKRYYNYHIIVDEKLNILEGFGDFY